MASDDKKRPRGTWKPIGNLPTGRHAPVRANRHSSIRTGFGDEETSVTTTIDAPRVLEMIEHVFPEIRERMKYEGEIARGGTGSIGVVFDRALLRRAAIKRLHAKTYNQPLLVRNFIREAQITGQLNHPNIVPVHEVGRDDGGDLYFTMKLVEGRSLSEMLRDNPRRDDHDRLLNVLEVVVKVCDALAFAHSRGVLHCDIKSENIMVGDFGEVYLMDWGGATLMHPRGERPKHWARDDLPRLSEAETKGLVFGTPAYMSPEQARAKIATLDPRSDVFSLGAVLYEVLTGRPPYVAKTGLAAIKKAQRADYVPLDERTGGGVFPRELVRITMKALAPSRSERYQSVEELKHDIQRLLRGGGNFPTVRYEAGTHVIREGEVGDAAYIVVSGQLEVYRIIDGDRVSLRVLGPGEVFGETAIFAESARTASVVAITGCTLIMVTGDVIESELDAMKPWMGSFIRTLASRFGESETRRLVSQRNTASHPVVPSPEDHPSLQIDIEESSRSITRGEIVDEDDDFDVEMGSSIHAAPILKGKKWWKRD